MKNKVQKYDEGFENFKYALFGFAIFFYLSTLILLIYNFKWFHPSSACSRNMKILIANIISIIIMTIMTVSGLGKNGSIITSGA